MTPAPRGICPRDSASYSTDASLDIFIAALFTIARKENNPNGL